MPKLHCVAVPNQKHVRQLLSNLFASRPSKNSRSGLLRERVFGSDLSEYISLLPDAETAIPPMVTVCAAALERYGVVDGIYRLSGSSSTVQALRARLDNGDFLATVAEEMRLSQTDDISDSSEKKPAWFTDIHSVAAVLKTYFRELPNPLFTFDLYPQFQVSTLHFAFPLLIRQLKFQLTWHYK